MPTYEYKCDACGNAFEKFQSITAKPIRKCPKCGKNKVRRLISTGAGLIFKGSGFYITDYRSDQYKNAAKADSGTKDKPADKPADTPAAKSAATAETPSPKTEVPAAPAKPTVKEEPKRSSAKRK